MFKPHEIGPLTGEELDQVVQSLALRGYELWGLGYCKFQIVPARYLADPDKEGRREMYALYYIHMPKRLWKRIRLELSDAETLGQLLGQYDDRSD